jgi:hypothetical protein
LNPKDYCNRKCNRNAIGNGSYRLWEAREN